MGFGGNGIDTGSGGGEGGLLAFVNFLYMLLKQK
jgi:hypothetical protein